MRYLMLFVFCLCSFCIWGQVNDMDITTVKKQDMADKFLVDVRTPEEFAEGHIKGALNLNYFDSDFAEQFKGVDREGPVYLYCRSGKRSAKAAKVLDSLGFEKIYNLKGGFLAWEKANKRKEKPGDH